MIAGLLGVLGLQRFPQELHFVRYIVFRSALLAFAATLSISSLRARETGAESPLLRHAFELVDLNNWSGAEPEFVRAAAAFRKNGDRVGLAYAELGIIRATIQGRNLAITSAELRQRLDSDPIMKSDRELRIFCLAIKGDIDGEMESALMREDWLEVARLAPASRDPRWSYRAAAELGLAAYYEGDLESARRKVGGALIAARQAHDIGAQVKYLYAVGLGLNATRMNSEAIAYLDQAIALSEATPGTPYPYMCYNAKADALLAMGKAQEARKISDGLLENERQRKSLQFQAITLQTRAQIKLAQHDTAGAVSDLNAAIELCQTEGYERALIEIRIMLADIYRGRGNLTDAERLLSSAATTTQRNGEVYTLPSRLRVLAEIQEARGHYAAADRTYDRAEAFIDANIGNDSAVLDKTAWIKSVSDLYVAHFGLIANHLDNPAKAYSVVEQVRGRIMTDLLLGGSQAPVKARENEKAISRLRLQMMAAKSNADVEKFREQIALLEQVRWLTPEISILKSRRYSHVPLRSVQEAMSADATILEYVVGEPASWCLVVRRNGLHAVRLAGRRQIEKLIRTYLAEVKDKQPAQAAARELYAALLEPTIGTARSGDLMIVRDGQLNLLPFDALRTASGKFVGEERVISYLPSAGSFYLLTAESEKSNPSRRVLAVGGVPYDRAADHFRNLVASHGFGQTVLSNLQNSREEANAAAAIASGAGVKMVL